MRCSAGVTSRALASGAAATLARTRLIAKARRVIFGSGKSRWCLTMLGAALMSRTAGPHPSIDALPRPEMRLQHHRGPGSASGRNRRGIPVQVGRARSSRGDRTTRIGGGRNGGTDGRHRDRSGGDPALLGRSLAGRDDVGIVLVVDFERTLRVRTRPDRGTGPRDLPGLRRVRVELRLELDDRLADVALAA